MSHQPDALSGSLVEAEEHTLIAAARAGHSGAVDELFRRHHPVAVALATRLAGPSHGEDLAAEAFAKVAALMARGKGPQVAFRAYLLTTVRSLNVDRLRMTRTVPVADFDDELLEHHEDEVDARLENGAISRAFAALPERWRTVLWHTEVNGESLAEVGDRLGMRPNAVAQLSYRAREGLREAYLADHINAASATGCRETLALLPKYARGAMRPRNAGRVEEHLERCASCTEVLAELREVNTTLGALLFPAGAGLVTLSGTGSLPPSPAPSGPGTASRLRGVLTGLASAGAAAALVALVVARGPVDSSPAVDVPSAPRSTGAGAALAPTEVRVGSLTASDLGTSAGRWVHVSVPLVATSAARERSLEPLSMTLELEGVARHAVHTNPTFGHWRCVGSARVLTCRLPRRAHGTSLDLGIDLVRVGGSRLVVSATLRQGDGASERTGTLILEPDPDRS
ncbi:MAG: sigma-70 family RNA polymerase sigma factor [Nocardioides sp.]|uniref:sigma-70 family RNA polymerase sigma factor n=1 Tax=Nocardioides sp. TaxID=35761 RepID=UPI003F0A0075